MSYPISHKMSTLKPSVIREILKYSSDPNVISFAAGNPASETFPVEKIAAITADILQKDPTAALQYSLSEGYPALRTTLERWLAQDYGIDFSENTLLITSGAQQGIDLVTKCLCDEGDTVLVEKPTFIGALNTFRSYGVQLAPVELEDYGLSLQSLRSAWEGAHNPRFLYIIPTFQNPSGVVTSLQKRQAILDFAHAHDLLILEDNPYGDLRIDGEPVPTIKSLDRGGDRVIYLGSFSKILAPALRVGFVVARNELASKLAVAKQTTDVHSNSLAQIICNEFLTRWDVNEHIAGLQATYRKKAQTMCEAIDRYLAGKVTYRKPQGGLFLWCTLPDEIDMLDFCERCVKAGLALVPGNAFYTDESQPCHSFRVNYSTPSDEEIVKGVQIMAEIVKTFA